METRLRLKPGQNGTKALTRKYGDRLVCVRYLYDYEKRQRHKTVELIEETVPWHPRDSRERHLMALSADEPVLVRVYYTEKALREKVRLAGGLWLTEERAWSLTYAKAKALGLADRILDK